MFPVQFVFNERNYIYIFFEKYWAPFDENKPHRMYSVTKSFVAIAVGFLEQEGKISLKQGYMHTIVIELSKNPDQTKSEIGGGIGGWN